MGIKFLCPNGHRLNVKSFLSGKRAFCPKCGARVLVPGTDGAAVVDADPATIAGLSSGEEAATALPATAGALPPRDTALAAHSTAAADAISEAPGAVWYVRPATGGQFGPASAEAMRGWLNEGRVGASSLVWRAGWPEWRAAAAVFPQLSGFAAMADLSLSPAPAIPPIQPGAAGVHLPPPLGGSLPLGHVVQSTPAQQPQAAPGGPSAQLPPQAQTAIRRRRQRDRRLYASAVLVAASIILLIVLFVVFRRQAQPTAPPTQEAAGTAKGPSE